MLFQTAHSCLLHSIIQAITDTDVTLQVGLKTEKRNEWGNCILRSVLEGIRTKELVYMKIARKSLIVNVSYWRPRVFKSLSEGDDAP